MNLLTVRCKEVFAFPQDRDEWVLFGDQGVCSQRLSGLEPPVAACSRPTGIAARIASVRDWSYKIETATIRRVPSPFCKNRLTS
jgi:hypothetical protein